MTKKQHKHADVIKAWADGETIEYRADAGMKWTESDDPAWASDCEYRVKPARSYPETTMSDAKLLGAYAPICRDMGKQASRNLANAAIRHAIDAGQVVTREEFDRLTTYATRAVSTLHAARYTDNGGELWKPPLGDRDKRDMAVAEAVKRAAVHLANISGIPAMQIDYMDLSAIIAKAAK